MEEVKRFQGSTFDTIARRNLVDDQDTILELTGKIQELQSEINCMNDSRDFQDAESVRSGQSHVTSQPVTWPPWAMRMNASMCAHCKHIPMDQQPSEYNHITEQKHAESFRAWDCGERIRRAALRMAALVVGSYQVGSVGFRLIGFEEDRNSLGEAQPRTCWVFCDSVPVCVAIDWLRPCTPA